jgi:hypothetical protein
VPVPVDGRIVRLMIGLLVRSLPRKALAGALLVLCASVAYRTVLVELVLEPPTGLLLCQ